MTVTNENLHTSIWNCLSTKITYMEIWKAWLPRHISYSTSSMPFWNSEMASSPTSLLPNNSAPHSSSMFSLSPPGSDTPTHPSTHVHCQVNCFLDPPSLTCFMGSGAFRADNMPAAHRGAGAQVELVFAHRFQVTQDPLGGVGVADVYSLQRPHFSVVD